MIKNELLLRDFNEKKIYISSNGINSDYFNLSQPGALAYDGVFLGRMNASKGVDDLLTIWKKVCEKNPEAKLAIIGGAEKKFKLEFIQRIKSAGLEKNILVLGFLEDEKAFSLLKASKVFIFPSHEEGWGIVVAQALACGVPVVSWDLSVYKEIFENHTIRVEENNTNLFAETVVKLLENDFKRKEIGESGYEFIKKCSWKEVAKKELEIIKV